MNFPIFSAVISAKGSALHTGKVDKSVRKLICIFICFVQYYSFLQAIYMLLNKSKYFHSLQAVESIEEYSHSHSEYIEEHTKIVTQVRIICIQAICE